MHQAAAFVTDCRGERWSSDSLAWEKRFSGASLLTDALLTPSGAANAAIGRVYMSSFGLTPVLWWQTIRNFIFFPILKKWQVIKQVFDSRKLLEITHRWFQMTHCDSVWALCVCVSVCEQLSIRKGRSVLFYASMVGGICQRTERFVFDWHFETYVIYNCLFCLLTASASVCGWCISYTPKHTHYLGFEGVYLRLL